jgi:hypothetical protein
MRINPWTDQRKAKLKTWWLEEQFTSTEIVELFRQEGFRTTRNAVIGAVHRSPWWADQIRHRPPEGWRKKLIDKTVKKLKKKGVYDKLDVIVIEPPPPPPVKLRTPPEQPPPKPVPGQPLYLSVVEISHDQCRYWYGESWGQAGRKHQTGYCGQPTSPGNRSWCPEHLKLVYSRAPSPGRQSVPVKF